MTDKKPRTDLRVEIFNEIKTALASGTPPWAASWDCVRLPYNGMTNATYRGLNILRLWAAQHTHGYKSSAWVTFKQMCDINAKYGTNATNKGAKGTAIIRWVTKAPGDEDAEAKGFSFPKVYHVFNFDQIQGLPEELLPKKREPFSPGADHARVMDFVAKCGAKILEGEYMPAYSPAADEIKMPVLQSFHTAEDHASTLLHELVHWSAAPLRCNRPLKAFHVDEASYAFEELIAEIGSALLCAEFGIALKALQHPAYIQSYLKALGNDHRKLTEAFTKADEACNWLLMAADYNSMEIAAE